LVTVAGEIDILTASELRDQLSTLPDGDIVLDFSGVRLLAAAGLRVLLELLDRRARAGMREVLAAPSPSVQRVLVVTQLARTLSMTATLDDAVALITAAPSRGGSTVPRNATDRTLPPCRAATREGGPTNRVTRSITAGRCSRLRSCGCPSSRTATRVTALALCRIQGAMA
jgi:anti-anti-sigma factor